MNITIVVGTRPNYIKLSPLLSELQKQNEVIVIDTGQHYDHEMSGIFFQEMRIPDPDYVIGARSGNEPKKMANEITPLLEDIQPDLVCVIGDTNSTLAGAISADQQGCKLAHIESGLRSFDSSMPEERNRIAVDRMSDILFCPCENARNNLIREGIKQGIWVTGDIIVDVMNRFKLESKELGKPEYNNYTLLTLHRQSTVDNEKILMKIIEALENTGEEFVFPVHPRTEKNIAAFGICLPANIVTIRPQGYLEMLNLLYNADKVVTDSGGLQKEAYVFAKPCITLRNTTEWVETLESGWNTLIPPEGSSTTQIAEAIRNCKEGNQGRLWYYGNGHAAYYMARIINQMR